MSGLINKKLFVDLQTLRKELNKFKSN